MEEPRSGEPDFSDSEDILDYSLQDNEFLNLKLRLPDQTSHKISGEAYKMSDDKRGRCLIINNYEFKTSSTRPGSEVDITNLSAVFKELGFHVILKTNIEGDNFRKVIAKELENPDHTKLDMFVLIIMSHGKKGSIICGTDDVEVYWPDLLKMVYNCKELKGKPKFIVISACAGEAVPKCTHDNASGVAAGYSVDAQPSDQSTSENQNDVLILKSAFEGFVSIRQPKFGTPIIRVLVEALYKHAHHSDLKTICERIKKKIMKKNETTASNEQTPIPTIDDFLRKKLHLFSSNVQNVKEVKQPKDLKYLMSLRVGEVYSVQWLPEHGLACGLYGQIQVYGKPLRFERSYPITENERSDGPACVWSICEYGTDYLVLQGDIGCRLSVDHYSSEFEYQRNVVYGGSSGYQMSVKWNKILLIDDPSKNVKLYTTDGAHLLTVNCQPHIDHAWGIQFQDENSFIVSDWSCDKVLKFNLEADGRPVWTSKGLQGPRGIYRDISGNVYVANDRSKNIYVLLPSGDSLKISSPKLYNDLYSISVSGDLLAAGSKEGVQLFKIKYST